MYANDAEENQLQSLLFGLNGGPDCSSEEIAKYILKLGSYNVEQLHREPQKLLEEQSLIQERKQELALNNYRTFIQTAECSKASFEQFVDLEKKLNSLLEHIPKFEEKCQQFSKESESINQKRKINSITMAKNTQLLEILELPQLMSTFIRDKSYDEALEVASYVRKLESKHQDIPIIKDIVKEVDKLWLQMQRQLVAQLSTQIQLPNCLQIVGHLRRMGTFTESELRLKFLHARNAWLEQSLKSIVTTDAGFHLSKTIEITRINLFSIINQYRAVFNDDEHSPLTVRSPLVNQNSIFFGWIRAKIADFLRTLEEDLNSADITSMDSYLGQCMYFGLSFSKVGCDFRQLLAPVFSRAVHRQFSRGLFQATASFRNNLEKFTLINKNASVSKWKSKTATTDSLQPPESLLEFYPLANYLNKVLSSFSALRLCPIISIIDDITQETQESLVIVSQRLLKLYGQEHQAFTANSRDSFTRLCMTFANDLVPFVQKALHIIYPPNCLAQYLGISVQELHDSGISYLDKEKIIESIIHLLPTHISTKPVATLDVSEIENYETESRIRKEESMRNEEAITLEEPKRIEQFVKNKELNRPELEESKIKNDVVNNDINSN